MNILSGKDDRLLMIVGPCSVHDPIAILDYANRLAALSKKCPRMFFVMRTYFEKPRTRKGWSGFMHDPNLDGTNSMEQGVLLSRKLLLDITRIGLPCATETLSLIAPQYIDDLLSFACIGARTTESQPHRELASGLSVPVGFKKLNQWFCQCGHSFDTLGRRAKSVYGCDTRWTRGSYSYTWQS